MDVGVIVYCAELEAPALRETARRILEAEAARFGVSLEPAEVLLRRGHGGSTMHVVAAADELVRHLAAAEPDPLAEDGPLMVLARAGRYIRIVRDSQAGTCSTERETAAGHAVAARGGDGTARPANREPTARPQVAAGILVL